MEKRILAVDDDKMNLRRTTLNESPQYIQELVRQYCPFERVYLQKASAAIARKGYPLLP